MMKKRALINYVKIRSFLIFNVDNLLENLTQFRHNKLIDSDDLFFNNSTEVNSKLTLKKNSSPLSKLDILLREKESLGLYISGDPMESYLDLETYVQDSAYREDIHLILINKIKKIFTKKNKIMFALLVNTPKGDFEAIIFPKIALELSPLLEEKKLFWVIGKITNENKTSTVKEDEDGKSIEYEQKPKILIENLLPLYGDLIKFLDSEKKKLATSSIRQLKSLNITDFINSTSKENVQSSQTVDKIEQSKTIETYIVKIPNNLPRSQVEKIKQSLSKSNSDNSERVIVEVQLSSGEWKKAKGEYFANIDLVKKILEKI
jgi:DNA polymerase III alpha subunit